MTDLTADPRELEVFDAEKDDPSVVTPDMTWAEFASSIRSLPGDAQQLTVLHMTVLAKGHRDEVVDLDALANSVQRRKATVTGFLGKLERAGWVKRFPTLASNNRAVVVYRTAKAIDG